MTRRAELEQQTRRRITESTVALHAEVGPARTSISAVAKRAGVRRSTVYRHFPDEEALYAACSAHYRAANPRPDPQVWTAINDPRQRVEIALRELYGFYRRVQDMYTSLLRDEPLVPIVGRLLRPFHDYLDTVEDGLMSGRRLRGNARRRTRAAVGHAIAFSTWRSLAHDQGLSDAAAASLMCLLIEDASLTVAARARERHASKPREAAGQATPPPI
jgi:AcrR family transcriptional regulator